jgi:hypothetical protein
MQLRFLEGHMGGRLQGVEGFPGDVFCVNVPECIGDTAQATFLSEFESIRWAKLAGAWSVTARAQDELSYRLLAIPGQDTLDIEIHLTNESDRVWEQSMAFNCFSCYEAPAVRDFELVRHHIGARNPDELLRRLPRRASARSGVQVFGVNGAPPIDQIPFAAAFQATAPFVAQDWLAVSSRDGRRLVAAVSKPALFLFQNCEFACIHSAPGFGRLAPGQSARALTRLYFVEDSLRGWYARMRAELG